MTTSFDSGTNNGLMRWRARAFVDADVNIQEGTYPLDDAQAIIATANAVEAPLSRRLDIFFGEYASDDDKLEQAFLRAIDLVELFLDKIAIAGWAAVRMVDGPIVGPEWTNRDDFVIGVSQAWVYRSPIAVGPSNFLGLTDEPKHKAARQAARLIRRAMSTYSPEEAWLYVYSALELMAKESTTEHVMESCSNCGFQKKGQLATARRLREILNELGIDKKTADWLRNVRGSIAHGGALQSAIRINEIQKALGAGLGRAITLIATAGDASVRRERNVVPGLPLVMHRIRRIPSGDFLLIDTRWMSPATFPEVSNNADPASDSRIEIGMPMKNGLPIIPEWAWPDHHSDE